jgi:heme/copper-type cytochrome/quinol oxidase subunit 2
VSKWSLLFLTVPVAGVAIFAAAEYLDWSLPPVQSTLGAKIDHLYYVVLAITGVTFIFTQLGLAFLVCFYARPRDGATQSSFPLLTMLSWLLVPLAGFALLLYWFPMPPESRLWMGVTLAVGWPLVLSLLVSGRSARGSSSAWYLHGNNTLEVVWTIVPAIIFIGIAIYQYPLWQQLRYPKDRPEGVVPVRVIGRQFEWRMVYPGRDQVFDTADDLVVPNELHVVKGKEAWIDLRAMDVLHSFFLPMHRVKQDAVPGLTIPVWFDCVESTWQFQEPKAAFEADDLIDLAGLAAALDRTDEPAWAFLKEKISPEARLAKASLATWVEALNGLLEMDDLSPLASDTKVKPLAFELKQMVRSQPAGARRRLLHRKLVDRWVSDFVRPLGRDFDIVCAELCGWGHYKMKGRLFVHETPEQLAEWLEATAQNQEVTQ